MLAVATAPIRHGLLVAALVLLVTLALPGQAVAEADASRFRGESAVATWLLDDEWNTSVTVSALDGVFHTGSGPPEDAEQVAVSVFQSFCDDDADELVFRIYSGFAEAAVDVDHARLTEAGVDGELTLEGFETREDGCADPPDLPPFPDEPIGTVDVEVSTSWEGVGELNRSRSTFHLDEPGFKIRSQSMQRSRDAEATGTLIGLGEVGPSGELDEADFATITSFKSSDVIIEQPQ